MKYEGRVPPILLVEDSAMDMDLTRHAFNQHQPPHPIVVARDGEEALAFIERWDAGEPRPAVILLDIKLPKVGGLEVLARLKAHPRYREIPVVMLTTSDDDGDMRTAYDLGANSYIVKPGDFDQFMEVAERIEVYWCMLNQLPGVF